MARGDKVGATKEKEHFEQMRASIPESALWVSNVNRAQDVMQVASEILAARLSSRCHRSLA